MMTRDISPRRRKTAFLVLVFTILWVMTARIAFVADATPPVLYNESPTGIVGQPSVYTGWWLEPTLSWLDPNSVDLSTAVVKVNGIPIQTYAWYETDDGDTPPYIVGGIAGAGQQVAVGGYYTLEASITNMLGYTATKTWTVLYNQNPETVTVTPYYDSFSNPPKPNITATIKDDFGGTIDQASIKMYFDGQQVAHTYTSISSKQGIISYTPAADLPNGSTHTVKVNYADTLGGAATTTWVFEVNSKPSMVSATPAACTNCHFYKYDPYWADSINVYFNKTHNVPPGGDAGLLHRCEACHREDEKGVIRNSTGIVAPFVAPSPGKCALVCHNNQPHNLQNAQHIKSTSTSWYVYGGVSQQASLGSPRTGYDCEYCHQQYGRWPFTHELITKHTVSIDEECASCHSAVLTREHAGPSRTDSQGNALTCDTCHNNTSTTGNTILQLNTANMGTRLVVPPKFRFAESAPWSIAGRKISGIQIQHYGAGTVEVYYYKDGVWAIAQTFGYKEDGWKLVPIPEAEQIKLVLLIEVGVWGEVEGKTVNLVPDPSSPMTCALCHASSHADYVALHDVGTTLDTTCQQCHAANLMDEHEAKVTEYSCDICHGDAVALPQGGNCSDCHGSSSTAHQSIDHTAALGSGPIVLFPDNGHDDAGRVGSKPYFSVSASCTLCHNTDVPAVHGNVCATCHPAPFNTLGTWSGGCQQGGCHPSYHENSTNAHLAFEDPYDGGNDCLRCHDATWSVTQAQCLNCHAGPQADYTTAPVTTSDARASYVGPAEIDFSVTVNGKVALGRTFYNLDGGATVAAGKSLRVDAPGSHTLEFWSMDQFGRTEAAHRTVSFTVAADNVPPTTTSDAQSTYSRAAVITLTASDASSLGVKTTYYRINGGATQTGTSVTIPAPNGTVVYSLTFWSDDWAGNVEAQKTVTFTVTGGNGTLRLIWGDSDVSGSPCPSDPSAKAKWTVHSGGFSGPVVDSGSAGCPNWSGVADRPLPLSTAPYSVRIEWWDSWEGYYDQTDFSNVLVSTPGQVVRLVY
ncbi:MAG: hypothetical protein HY900_33635 [Deltaproteobacteria bacterium]|nr:hypothetical protein [Deltaproteobacteria bacterium]